MKKLKYKLCRICGNKIIGVRRKDRKSFYYSRQCMLCYKKCRNETKRRENISKSISGLKHPSSMPLLSIRIVNRNGKPYKQIKIKPSLGWVYEHRYIYSQYHNINLPSNIHIHHIDKNTLNNNVNNLKALNFTEHLKIHNHLSKWSKNFDKCIKCNTIQKKHVGKGLCTTCYQKI